MISLDIRKLIILTAAAVCGLILPLSGVGFDLPDSADDFHNIQADSWSVVGRNLIAKGNVHIPANNIEIYADEAVVNLDNKDLEAIGNIRMFQWKPFSGQVKSSELAELENRPDTLVTSGTVSGNLWGDQMISVSGYVLTDSIRSHHLAGNLNSGYFRGDKVELEVQSVVCKGESFERLPDGVLKIKNGQFSSCSYLMEGNGHYSIGAGEITFYPHHPEIYGVENISTKSRDHSIWLTNGIVRAYGIPILWLPVFYKPKDFSPGLFGLTWGKQSDWGYFISASRRFDFTDYPQFGTRLMVDYYNLRGVGYGGRIWSDTDDSSTEIFAYSIRDIRPNEAEDYDHYRLHVPHNRYNFRITHLNHITPRLDFRGAFDWSSDYYFTRDFFSIRFNGDPQPSTYAALEHQFDRFSLSLMFRPRINKFYTTVEKLPDIRLDIIRQELFNSGIYYQGEYNPSYMQMRWIDFDSLPSNREKHPKYTELKDYEAFRFDTTHFLYLPLNLKFINIVPRAGFKFTAYSSSSKRAVSENELISMFAASDPQSLSTARLRGYDSKGGGKTRLLGELGVEASTKIHNTWPNLRSKWLGIDGVRHIFRPYLNYTFINDPSVDRDHLMYFDDIDRIDEQNFFRFGFENRLQTRAGSGVRDFFSMENFFDIYLNKQDGFGDVKEFGHVGDFGTIISWSILKNLNLSTSALISVTDENGPVPPVKRDGKEVDVGLKAKWLNRWNISLRYSPIDDINLNFSFNYRRPYSSRSAYSMGSTLTQIEGGGYFDKHFDDHSETISFGGSFPLTPDRRTRGMFNCSYDIHDGGFSDISFSIVRVFHCWELIGQMGFEADDDHSSGWATDFSIQARLTGLEAPLQSRANSVLGTLDPYSPSAPTKGFSF